MRFRLGLIALALVLLPVFGWLFWRTLTISPTLQSALAPYEKLGEEVKNSLSALPVIPPVKAEDGYTLTDDTKEGIEISYPNQKTESSEQSTNPNSQLPITNNNESSPLSLKFPDDIGQQPLEVTLPSGKAFSFTNFDPNAQYTSSLISSEKLVSEQAGKLVGGTTQPLIGSIAQSFLSKVFPEKGESQYLQYQSEDGRKLQYYAYGADQASGEKKLKHWTLYTSGTGEEKESYTFDRAKLRKNENGSVSVYYFDEGEIKNKEEAQGVDGDLLDRAARVLASDAEQDILSGSRPHDALIPAPYVLDKDGGYHELEWEVADDHRTLSVSYQLPATSYPLALDPTLAFTAPAISNTGDVITGEAGSSFGVSVTAGDFNIDGRTDLAVGASGYSSSAGRVYIFYNDGSLPTIAATADVTINSEGGTSQFGIAVAAGDFNADGRTDLIVGAEAHSGSDGRAYIFYNDESFPTAAASADVIISGESNSRFGADIVVGDFNFDGRTDFTVGGYQGATFVGRAYIFYNDGSIPTTAASADVRITGEASTNQFSYSLASGDFNADGRIDLAVGAYGYSTFTGRAYIFYNDGSIPTTAATADVIITGGTTFDLFGFTLTSGDFNTDGRIDLVVGASGYSTSTGRAYIFYNDGSIPTTAATADVIITGEASSAFGTALTFGDMNADGRTDLIVYGSSTDIFYNDGSYPSTSTTADVRISGVTPVTVADLNSDGRADLVASGSNRVYLFYSQNGQVNTNISLTGAAINDQFGRSMVSGDFNADGRTDLAVDALGYSSNAGRVYIFYGDGQWPSGGATADVIITGEASSQFGLSLASGDWNADGKVDLAAGAKNYSTDTGRVYLFYNGSIITEAATGADVIITGEASSYFGSSLTSGDFNADGKTDLAAGAFGYSSDVGRTYLFYNGAIITEAATGADVIITGEASSFFGSSLTSGDFNADGKTDLVAGTYLYDSYAGRAYIFYNDGSIPTTAATADIIITGQASSFFTHSLVVGDFNTDGRADLAVGAIGYSSDAGRAYIFYNDGSLPTTASSADVIITGEASSLFGQTLAAGDWNADGRIDLAIGAVGYSTNTGRTYFFYNDGSIPTTAATADLTITGETTSNYFGGALTAGDFNGDGRVDLVVGAYGYSTSTGRVYIYETRENFAWQLQRFADSTGLRVSPNVSGEELRITGETSSKLGQVLTSGDLNGDGRTDLIVGGSGYSSNAGRVYVFYNDGSISTGAANADIVITGEASSQFGYKLIAGDINADGKDDLVAGAIDYSSNAGRAYVFYQDGTWPALATGADAIMTGEASGRFTRSFGIGDFNADGKADLAVGSNGYSSNVGRVYIFYNGSITTESATGADLIITGATASNLGASIAVGDFNTDSKLDLAVGGWSVSSNAGRVYIFYNDGSIPTTAATADGMITGEASSNYLGEAVIVAADMNADGRTDIVATAYGYSSDTGRAYIFYNDGTSFGTAACTTDCAAGNADVKITGEASSNYFGLSLTGGDFNGDGRTDIAVGAYNYSSGTGRAYLFYNDGSIPTTAATADLILTGEASSSQFGYWITAGDFNSDGKADLAVGSNTYSSSRGRIYMYTFNDNVITGEATSEFGVSLITGDFNFDGETDLAVGARSYSTSTGRVYLFYNDGSIPTSATSADVIITGGATSDTFGISLASGDFNFDGRIDLAVGAQGYSSNTGRAYIFHNDGSIPTTAATADVIITGGATSNYFASFLTSGDFNTDGRTDLAVGAFNYSTATGRAYIFHNDGSIPTSAATADVTITGEATNNYFGAVLVSGDLNADGRTDLAITGQSYSGTVGRTYIFHNDGSIPTTAATADVIISGEGGYFGTALSAGDFNTDGRIDLAVGAYDYSSSRGRAYIFYNDGSIPTTAATADISITGESGSGFGLVAVSGDWNSDGRTDLGMYAYNYSSNTGRVYLLYNDGSIPTSAATADVILTGQTSSNYFGYGLASGDLNADGKEDLAIGAYGYSSSAGRVYVFITEAAVASTGPEATQVKGTIKAKGGVKFK